MKYKNLILITAACFACTLVTGCNNEPEKPKEFHVTFKNYDDSVLYHTKVQDGAYVSYKGPTPEKEKTVSHHFVFRGRDKPNNHPITDNIVFTAQFDEAYNQYEVKFLNYDNSVLETCLVDYGSYAKYSGSTPIKHSEDKHIEHTFTSWDKNVESIKITRDTTFKAVYRTDYYNFAEFYNYDNSLLYVDKVLKNTTPTYEGAEPHKPYTNSNRKIYRFKNWDKEITPISEDTKYYPVFDLLDVHKVTFKYASEILYEQMVVHGEDAHYEGNTPALSSHISGNYKYYYTFDGWDGDLRNITEDRTFYALFTEHVESLLDEEDQIKEHLNNYGNGSYHNVNTGSNTTLGYSGSKFFVGYITFDPNGTTISSVGNFEYGSSIGRGMFTIELSGYTMLEVSYDIYTSGHYYEGYGSMDIAIDHLDSETRHAAGLLIPRTIEEIINNASRYLSSRGLAYIW